MAKERDLLLEFLEDYSEECVDKAFEMYKKINGGITILDIKGKKYFLKVRSESTASKYYDVTINVFNDGVDSSCNCKAKDRLGSCKHVAVATIYILIRANGMSLERIMDLFDVNEEDDDIDDDDCDYDGDEIEHYKIEVAPASKITSLSPGLVTAPVKALPGIDQWHSFTATPQNIFNYIHVFYGYPSQVVMANTSLVDINEKDVIITGLSMPDKSTSYHPMVKYDGNNTFFNKCDCKESTVVCPHVRAIFQLLAHKDTSFFHKFKSYDAEKNAMLKPYGLTISDKEAADIEFKIDPWGNISMKQPAWLWKADITDNLKGLKHILTPQNNNRISRPDLAPNTVIDFEIGFLFNLNSQHFKTGFEFELMKISEKNDKPQFKKLNINQPANLPLLKELPDEVYEKLLGLTDEGVKKYLSDQGYRTIFNYSNPWQQLDKQGLTTLKRYYIGELQKLWPHLCELEHVYMLKEGTLTNHNVVGAQLSPDFLTFSFTITEDERYVTVWLKKELNGVIIPGDVHQYCGFLFEIDGKLHLPADLTDLDMLWQFEHGFIKIPTGGRGQVIKSIIPLLQRKYKVEVPGSLTAQLLQPEPVLQLLLKELDNKFLVFQPQYVYEGLTVNYEPTPENLFLNIPGSGYYVIERNAQKEKDFFENIRLLHPKFQKPAQNDFFYLPFEDTMKQNWFIETVAKLVEDNIPVVGMQDLKKHRYNTNKPKWEMKASSSIDWFDLQVQISFGEQVASLRNVRKALLSGQKTVVLGDGTFGVLPEEWLKQFGLLLKMGDEQKDGALRVSKLHYTLIDELHSHIDDEEILREINDKKQRLQNIGDIQTVKPAKAIKAKLRPYQLNGFQWFHTLDEMGWGGCLADDMGLGKTLQTITFLHYLKEKYKGSTHLVICPTSLIYNWENELLKFAPKLKYHIYYGLEREFTEEHFNDYDIIITSYGIIRNDLKELMQFLWHYIILDESQAIKNPDAQTNKALQLLKSKNRMILSGTPIQNNTYDLFAQFNFINPGLLGNREFFKSEFANPIDKNNDAEKTVQLRKLIYPFMLRRTKAQVATDLPDKTETILWCEMGKEQRIVYNNYKDYYRNSLMEKIAEVGMAKAGMYVLEGLLRLRQICDSPELVKDSEVATKKSVKIDELLREIEENTGGHKLLVFSQFTEMLHLIEESLHKQKINYAYLDGSTPASKRKEAVNAFQDDPDLRVFLISIRAGGLGLNLTAADYVYIVDPWWNPAVEQQAIDRTHRIGQTNKIFAYKMLCKDTVEEKILQLQQRKKQLASDLVTEDAGFIKKLTKDDIAFLFS